MHKRNEKILLEDILERMDSILEFTKDMDFKEFVADERTYYAVDRCFEIIGEAANKLSDEFILNHTEIEWQQMIAFRNLLIHEYFRVERNIEWNIIKDTLPVLREKIAMLLKNI